MLWLFKLKTGSQKAWAKFKSQKKSDKAKFLWFLVIPIGLLIFRSLFIKLYDSIVNYIRSKDALISDEQTELLNTKIQDAFNFWNDSLIIEVLKDLTKADYYKLKNKFGTKYRNPITGDITYKFFPFASAMNLTEWIAIEMKPENLIKLKEINPQLPL